MNRPERAAQSDSSPSKLLGLAAWVYFETAGGILQENAMQRTEMGRTVLRVAAVALAMLMVPLVASRVV